MRSPDSIFLYEYSLRIKKIAKQSVTDFVFWPFSISFVSCCFFFYCRHSNYIQLTQQTIDKHIITIHFMIQIETLKFVLFQSEEIIEKKSKTVRTAGH